MTERLVGITHHNNIIMIVYTKKHAACLSFSKVTIPSAEIQIPFLTVISFKKKADTQHKTIPFIKALPRFRRRFHAIRIRQHSDLRLMIIVYHSSGSARHLTSFPAICVLSIHFFINTWILSSIICKVKRSHIFILS